MNTASDQPLSPQQRLKNRRWNEKLKLAAGLAVLGFGFLRFVFDGNAIWPSKIAVTAAFLVFLALEGIALYSCSHIRLEN